MAMNKQYPREEDGVRILSDLDELMFKYYRNQDGSLHAEAYEVGQSLQLYFAVYSTTLINHTVEGKKAVLPTMDDVSRGLEAPFMLMLDNSFYRAHFAEISAAILMEMARMNTSRFSKDVRISHALQICKWEFISLISALISGTKVQREMDAEMRALTSTEMEDALALMMDMLKQKDKRVQKNG